MSESLRDRRILLTGGGSGIGRAVALRYLHEGATLTVLERSQELADQLRRDAPAASRSRLTVQVGDATDHDTLEQAQRVAAPDGQLDHLTCCVGVFDFYVSLREMSAEELDTAAEEVYRLNVLSSLRALRICYPALRRAQGSVTLTLSESAFYPVGGGALYGSSKWALRGAIAHLATDFAPDVRVNGVAPGGTGGTQFGGLKGLGQSLTADKVEGRDERIAANNLLGITPQPKDHAGAYRYLADPDDARLVTGVVLNTDAGRRM